MKTLVWVEHEGGALKDATLSAVTAAAKLGEVHLIVAGSGVSGVAAEAAKISGVGKVHVADDAAFDHALAENIAPLIVDLMGHHDAFVAPATSNGKNIAPRVAARLDVAQVSDIIKVVAADTFERPIYAGNAIATVESTDAKLVITVRGTAFAAAAASGGTAAIERIGGADREIRVELDPVKLDSYGVTAQAITAPGDVILCPNPSYPIHAFGFLMAGGVIRSVPSQPTPQFFEAVERAILKSSPLPKPDQADVFQRQLQLKFRPQD